MPTFAVANLPGPPGSLQRARLYYPAAAGNPAGGAVLDLALAEAPAGEFSGTVDPTEAQSAYPGEYEYEARQVSAQSAAAFDASTTVTLSRGAYAAFVVSGRYTDSGRVRVWLGTINADAYADLDGDAAPDAGAYAQSIAWGEDELDLYAAGGPASVPFAFGGGTAGQQGAAQRTVQRWATVLAGWQLYFKRPTSLGNLLASPGAAQTMATLDGAKRSVLDEIARWRSALLLLPGLTAATATERPGQFLAVPATFGPRTVYPGRFGSFGRWGVM